MASRTPCDRTRTSVPPGDAEVAADASRATPAPFDVVLVPDFQGTQAHVQEAQALLFLASWLRQYGGPSRLPLHLACIGEPPIRVQQLAQQAGARISVHQPLGIRPGHFLGNKLRGLEVAAETGQILLLDVDTLIQQDISPLGAWTSSLAAAPDDCPKVSLAQWERIHRALGLEMRAERRPCLAAELGLPDFPGRWLGYKVPPAERRASLPYFNGGVVWSPVACDLRWRWEENIQRIAAAFPASEGELKWIHVSDQAALAVSLRQLQDQGWGLRRLPDGFNCRWRNLYAGNPSAESTSILHLTTFLHDLPREPLSEAGLRAGIRSYLRHKLRRRFQRLAAAECLRATFRSATHHLRQAHRRCRQLEARILDLLESPAWRGESASSHSHPSATGHPGADATCLNQHGPQNQHGPLNKHPSQTGHPARRTAA